jgi:hypothetical protein
VSRDITAAVSAALNAANVPLLVFTELQFASGTVRFTNASYTFTWNGHDWLGLGRMIGIDPVEERSDVQSTVIKLRLSGVPSDMISIALAEHYQGLPCRIWVAPLDSDYRVIGSSLLFSGKMDTMQVKVSNPATITLTAVSKLADLERPRVRRYNDADQQAEYPGDLGLQFVEQMVEKQLVWGRG